eukprot:3934249-Rhodomonas_salina.1
MNLVNGFYPMNGPIVFYHHTGKTNTTDVFQMVFNFLLMAIYKQGNMSIGNEIYAKEGNEREECTFYLIVSDFEKNESHNKATDLIFSLTEKYSSEFGTFIKCYPIQSTRTEHLQTRVFE